MLNNRNSSSFQNVKTELEYLFGQANFLKYLKEKSLLRVITITQTRHKRVVVSDKIISLSEVWVQPVQIFLTKDIKCTDGLFPSVLSKTYVSETTKLRSFCSFTYCGGVMTCYLRCEVLKYWMYGILPSLIGLSAGKDRFVILQNIILFAIEAVNLNME